MNSPGATLARMFHQAKRTNRTAGREDESDESAKNFTADLGAMGLQNAYMRIKLATLPPPTVMTGTVTQATIDAVAIMLPTAGAPDHYATMRRFARMWPAIAAFTIGAALGALGFLAAGLLCLLAPAALCVVLAARLGRFDAADCVARFQA